ncbi:hypothetical protein ACIQG8_01310 [Pseudarthrobacter oxydans]|uniref:hypothetical protein n=1 Tax=Pseudarthrobacter oxydans TaxID=1671 RepID=UPI00380CDB1A
MEFISANAIDAVARSLYGETEYDALAEGQVKEAYRKRAQLLMKLATDCEGRVGRSDVRPDAVHAPTV